VFAELNRGEDVTKGLRKVDKSEMTHKNPALRAGNTVPSSTSSAGACIAHPVLEYSSINIHRCSRAQEADEADETTGVDGEKTR
jgi:hypothetical protein